MAINMVNSCFDGIDIINGIVIINFNDYHNYLDGSYRKLIFLFVVYRSYVVQFTQRSLSFPCRLDTTLYLDWQLLQYTRNGIIYVDLQSEHSPFFTTDSIPHFLWYKWEQASITLGLLYRQMGQTSVFFMVLFMSIISFSIRFIFIPAVFSFAY